MRYILYLSITLVLETLVQAYPTTISMLFLSTFSWHCPLKTQALKRFGNLSSGLSHYHLNVFPCHLLMTLSLEDTSVEVCLSTGNVARGSLCHWVMDVGGTRKTCDSITQDDANKAPQSDYVFLASKFRLGLVGEGGGGASLLPHLLGIPNSNRKKIF
jgi:hypothetical protein